MAYQGCHVRVAVLGYGNRQCTIVPSEPVNPRLDGFRFKPVRAAADFRLNDIILCPVDFDLDGLSFNDCGEFHEVRTYATGRWVRGGFLRDKKKYYNVARNRRLKAECGGPGTKREGR